MANLSFYNTGSHSTTAYIINLDPNWGAAPDNDSRFVDWYVDSSFYGTSYLLGSYPSYGYTSGGDITISGLSPSTTYDVQARVYSPNKGLLVTLYSSVTTSTIQIELWSWYSNELNALQSNGYVTEISYGRWNEFVNKINEVGEAAGLFWSPYYATLENTKMTSYDKDITAVRFNSVRNNINITANALGAPPANIPVQYSGDIIYGWYFTSIGLCINNCIVNL